MAIRNEIDLDVLERLLEEATPRPWAYDSGATSGAMGIWCAADSSGAGGSIFDVSDEYPRGDNAPVENCELTIAAVNGLPALITELRACRQALGQIAQLPDVHFDFVLGPRGSAEERGGKMLDPKVCPGCIADAALRDREC